MEKLVHKSTGEIISEDPFTPGAEVRWDANRSIGVIIKRIQSNIVEVDFGGQQGVCYCFIRNLQRV